MKKLLLGCSLAFATVIVTAGTASADSGRHLGQLGQECTANLGYPSLGAGNHDYQQFAGNNAGGVPARLAQFGPYCLP